LAELADKNPNVVALCADLIGSLKMEKFIEKAPERFFQVGIAEANMMGLAAGLSITGKFLLRELSLTFLLQEFMTRFVSLLLIPIKM
jgi:transketolase C-terminal domain/subunit